MENICEIHLPLLDTHTIFSCFLFSLFKDFTIVFSLFVNRKQTGKFFRLLAYPPQMFSAIECLKVTIREAAYYLYITTIILSYSVETETVRNS